ncbi:MAG: sigma-70 family RNA polymerase sigma factor [Phycisphaerales bacterium]|jgi:RNA polymerase sigma factor (sigma-70 family)|nr:sigma-70 family RNA polymerase sigma factor [Phycisphaerales bacterium]
MESDLPQLITQCLARDQRAWATLVDRYAPLVYAIARAHRFDEAACDDVAQTVFANLARALESIREGQALAAWLSTTTRRECWRLAKARSRQRQLIDAKRDTATEAQAAADEREVQRIEAAHRVRLGLQHLGERCRELIHALFGGAAVDYQVLSARLGIPVGSIGPTRQRCLAKLAQILSQLDGSTRPAMQAD